MALLIPSMLARSPVDSITLDIAPTPMLTHVLRSSSDRSYLAIDFDPAADGRKVDVQGSITLLPLRHGEVGFVLCSHVLEHVPDDAAATAEIKRVLSQHGMALIQVPRRIGVPTDEDASAGVEERVARFGQADHVRYYGDDFESRLEAAGLRVFSTSYSKILPAPLLRLIGAAKDEELWIATAGVDPKRFIDIEAATRSMARALMGSRSMERELEDVRAEAAEWRSRYEWLSSRLPIRLAAAAKRRIKSLGQRFSNL
jgi:SAM-dependent methyltransferase